MPSIIRITKAGYLKLVLKATVNVNLGTVDIQIGKSNPNTFSRRNITANGYVELSFEGMVAVGDNIIISTKSSVDNATLVYSAEDTPWEKQPAYSINLELVETVDTSIIGQIIHHASPNLHNTNKRYIPIDQVGGLILNKADYPIFYDMFVNTYIIDSTYVDELTFKVADCSAYPYLRGITTDQPAIGWQEQATDLPSHNHTIPSHSHDLTHTENGGSSSAKTVDAYELGSFTVISPQNETTYGERTIVHNYKGDIVITTTPNNSIEYLETFATRDYNNIYDLKKVALNDRERYLYGNTDGKSLTTDSKSISATNEVKSVSFFRYIIADNQD